MKQLFFHMLIGPPGSGKSTWREAYLSSVERDVRVVSNDDIVEQYAYDHGLTYTEAFNEMNLDDVTKQVKKRFRSAIDDNLDIIVDRTNLTEKGRRSFLSSLPKHYHRVAVVFSLPREQLDERLDYRATTTGKFIPKSVVNSMIETYQPPEIGEFHEIINYIQEEKA